MAAPLHLLLLLLLLFISSFLCNNINSSEAKSIFHVTKDQSTLQYLTIIDHGTPLASTKLVIDLGGPFLWLNCGSSSSSSSSSSRPISRGSIQCLAAKPKSNDHGSKKKQCHVFPENSITQIATQGDLVEDIMAVQVAETESIAILDSNFLFSCAPTLLLNGLASGAKGVLGLGRSSQISMASQIAAKLNSKLQFMLCLSSSNGVALLDSGSPTFGSGISDSLVYTPFITPTRTSQVVSPHEYLISLKAIKIGGKRISINEKEGLGEGIKLSTVVSYTRMESSVYATFVKAYERASLATNMTKASPVAPFGLCFSSRNIQESSSLGPKVPVIDLVLQSEMVKWRIHGRNSMVQVSNDVMCLGVLDGGLNLEAPIVLGGYQLEDTLLHFDLGASVLGFSRKVCSDLSLDFGSKDPL